MSLELAQDLDSPCPNAEYPVPMDDVLRTDDPTFDTSTPQISPTSITTTITSAMENENPVEVNSKDSAIAEAFQKRKQPLIELTNSEESYVRRLRMVYELYMPAPYRIPSNLDYTASTATASSTLPVNTSGFEELASKLPTGGPLVPEDLVARWRILWGNWMQLYEWHSGFYEKLRVLLAEDPDRIPKLFIDSRARLRSIYSKYCENQIKAAHIAEQHKEFFDEWRLHVGDKEDVISLLMQPVQRIMRYQLPISEIVKWTRRANLPSLDMWQKALDIMKEIPKDTQLILEAARIDGFPGVITALGTLRIRGDLLVASLSRAELAESLRFYAKALNVLTPNPASRNSAGLSFFPKLHVQTSAEDEAEPSPTATATASIDTPADATTTALTSTIEPTLLVTNYSTATPPPLVASQNQISRNSLEIGETASAQPPLPLLPGGQKFVISRLFLFDRMLLVTEEVKAKRRGTSADAFAQSTYQFRAAINVNKMKFEPHWFMCTFDSELTGSADMTHDRSTDWLSVRAALEFAASDDLRFALWDQTPGRDVIYVIDPQIVATRSAWVVHLRDIQRMQQQLLMALEDPTRFAGGDKEWGFPPALKTEMPTHRSQTSREQAPSTPQSLSGTPNTSQQARKWPSFSMRRSSRLGSASSTLTPSTPSASHSGSKSKPTTPAGGGGTDGFGGSLLRSFSVERHRLVLTPLTPTCTMDLVSPTNERKLFVVRSASSPHRKRSDAGDKCSAGFGSADREDWSESTRSDMHRNSVGFQKTKKAFSNLFFGKNPKKGRSPATTPTFVVGTSQHHHHHPPSSASSASPSRPSHLRVDSLPPPHPTTLTNASDIS